MNETNVTLLLFIILVLLLTRKQPPSSFQLRAVHPTKAIGADRLPAAPFLSTLYDNRRYMSNEISWRGIL